MKMFSHTTAHNRVKILQCTRGATCASRHLYQMKCKCTLVTLRPPPLRIHEHTGINLSHKLQRFTAQSTSYFVGNYSKCIRSMGAYDNDVSL